MNADPRFTYNRAVAGYDEQFEQALADAIITAIGETSIVSDARVMAVRTGETASAFITVLAAVLAMSPAAVRSPTATRRTIDELGKRLRRRVAIAPSSRPCASSCAGSSIAFCPKSQEFANEDHIGDHDRDLGRRHGMPCLQAPP